MTTLTACDNLYLLSIFDWRKNCDQVLELLSRALHPDFALNRSKLPQKIRTDLTFAGNLAFISIFDAVQVIENSRMTGLLIVKSDAHPASVSFLTKVKLLTPKPSSPSSSAFRATRIFCSTF